MTTPNADYERTLKLYATTDAMVWAEEWCKVAREIRARGDEIVDEGWMLGWFANAIETAKVHERRAQIDSSGAGQ